MSDSALTASFLDQALKVNLPPNITARGGWKFDIAALVDACGLLNLEKEVRIRFTAGGSATGSGTLAAHRVKLDMDTDPIKYYHGITISQDLDIEQGNETLWHEFRHAWQAEAYAKVSGKALNTFYSVAYKNASGSHGQSYENNRFEIDAKNFAARMVSEGKWLLAPRHR